MSDGGSVLPQAEIDALFKQATGMSISPAAKTAGAEKAAAPAPPPPPAEKAKAEPAAVEEPAPAPQPPPAPPPPPLDEDPPTPPPAARPAPRPASPLPSSDGLVEDLQISLDDLARRLGAVEASISRINRSLREKQDDGALGEGVAHRISDMNRELRRVSGQVESVKRSLNNTPISNLRDEFVCDSCGSHGLIAIPMKCTQCGEEGWWGWWTGD